MNEQEIRVLIVEPMKEPYAREIGALEDMQKIVGGHIEAAYPFAEPVALVVNEEGKLLGLPENRVITGEDGLIPIDIICGTFFVAGVGAEDFVSLTDEQIRRYTKLYSDQMILSVAPEPVPERRGPAPERTPADIMGAGAFPDPEPTGRNIRFIDSAYNTLFTLPDGANLALTRYDGEETTFPCHYIDDTHFEAFGETWHIAQFAKMMERNGNIYRPEHPRPGDILDTYEIYQLKDIHGAGYWYMPYEYAKGKIRPEHYEQAYRGVLAPKVSLEALYNKHNRDKRPFREQTRSMSISDIVVLKRNGEQKAFYVDRVGFAECKEFLNPPKRAKSQRKRNNPER